MGRESEVDDEADTLLIGEAERRRRTRIERANAAFSGSTSSFFFFSRNYRLNGGTALAIMQFYERIRFPRRASIPIRFFELAVFFQADVSGTTKRTTLVAARLLLRAGADIEEIELTTRSR